MRWSTRFIMLGILIIALGFLPFVFRHFTWVGFETSASFFAVGLLIFLIGWGMRKIRKGMEKSSQQKAPARHIYHNPWNAGPQDATP